MKNIFLYFVLCIFGLSCHKEEPFDFSYTANPDHDDVFHHLKFDCQEVNGPSSFVGTVDGKPYCMLDTNLTDTHFGMVSIISTPDPVINLNGDSNAVSTAFRCRMEPKEPIAGSIGLWFLYYSNGLTGYTKEGFFNEFFVPGLHLPLSTFFTTSPPNV